jgi:hypothetical protein
VENLIKEFFGPGNSYEETKIIIKTYSRVSGLRLKNKWK